MTPLATVASMETRLGLTPGSLSGADLQRATDALDDASVLVRAEADYDFLAEDGVTIDAPDVIVMIARRVALRQYRNPDEFVSENMGGGAYGYRYSDDGAAAYLTPSEIRQIGAAMRAYQPKRVQGSVRTPSGYENPDGVYAVADGGGWLMGEE